MLSTEANERLTSVGKGTPMGELMRRYWHPVGAAVELDERPTKEVRLLGEDLVLYKDRSGTIGLVARLCAHRRVNLAYGIPEEHGLRCMYHGWMYDETGQCIEQPFEETVHPPRVSRPGAQPGSSEVVVKSFKEKVRLDAYPVQELGGLLWAYLGPAPVPLLPRWDLFVWNNVLRDIGTTLLPCNWLQCMENSVDPVHLEWLHGYWSSYQVEAGGVPKDALLPNRLHTKISFEPFKHGIIKRRTYTDTTEDDPEWRIGHPIVFPNWLRVGTGFQIRVPVDDTHTMHVHYNIYAPPPGVTAPEQEVVPFREVPLYAEDGRFAVDFTIGQDQMAWVTQGPLADRPKEKLGESDRGIILYRKMLMEQMEVVARGEEPLNVFRDPGENEIIELFQERERGTILDPPRMRHPLPGQVDPVTGDISLAPTGKHAPVGLVARGLFRKAAEEAGIEVG